MKNLVIVESPAKAKTIERYLGKDYEVKSSYGHIRDLPKQNLSIDIEHNFEPKYIISDDKTKIVSELEKAVAKAEVIWLASDEDREGEAIAWHLSEVLKLQGKNTHRIVFNEITKNAILNAIEHPRSVDMNLVNAQQARRVLDRIVGYEISPILWSKIKPSLSAGRVQSVAVRLIAEREDEIARFESQSYFKIVGLFRAPSTKQILSAELDHRFNSEEEAATFLGSSSAEAHRVKKVESKMGKRTPAAPFTTSTLQQEASRKLGFSVSRTMQVAQQLYESGYITYMRTDSTNLSTLALSMAKTAIIELYGKDYHHSRKYTTKIKGAQEAHEAIRPTDFSRTSINADSQQQRLYELIWKRAIASQMSDADIEKNIIEIAIDNHKEQYIASSEHIVFDGFLKVYIESTDDEQDDPQSSDRLPALKENDEVALTVAKATQHFTQHPPRYTEASLVKRLEELGIGRPSTYAPTISTILKREYVVKEDRPAKTITSVSLTQKPHEPIVRQQNKEQTGAEKGKLFPTDIGVLVNNFLIEHFADIMDYNFTAKVEKDFDDIANGTQDWHSVINNFYTPFHENIRYTQSNSKRSSGERLLGIDPKSGNKVYAKIGRFGAIVQIGETSSKDKPVFASLRNGQSITTITLEEALELCKLPRTVGDFENSSVVVSNGRFGPYIKHNDKFYSLPKDSDPYSINIEECCSIIARKRVEDAEKERIRAAMPRTIGSLNDAPITCNIGRFGPYLSHNNKNYRLPKAYDPLTISQEQAIEIIESSSNKKKTTSTRRKKQ